MLTSRVNVLGGMRLKVGGLLNIMNGGDPKLHQGVSKTSIIASRTSFQAPYALVSNLGHLHKISFLGRPY